MAIGYDSRIKSDLFAKVAAEVFAANGVKVNIWPVLMPVPTVSFASMCLKTSVGVMITASHNPSTYNGYRVYGFVKYGRMPDDPVMIKTIVTTDMGERIASHYGVRTINVLTGFKYIGEQIGRLERQDKADSYFFGFEENYGYLTGSYVRDKDGVDEACMICEMFSYYKTRGVSLPEKLDALSER